MTITQAIAKLKVLNSLLTKIDEKGEDPVKIIKEEIKELKKCVKSGKALRESQNRFMNDFNTPNGFCPQ